MKFKQVFLVFAMLCLGLGGSALAASKAEIDRNVQLALTAFYKLSAGNKELAAKPHLAS